MGLESLVNMQIRFVCHITKCSSVWIRSSQRITEVKWRKSGCIGKHKESVRCGRQCEKREVRVEGKGRRGRERERFQPLSCPTYLFAARWYLRSTRLLSPREVMKITCSDARFRLFSLHKGHSGPVFPGIRAFRE